MDPARPTKIGQQTAPEVEVHSGTWLVVRERAEKLLAEAMAEIERRHTSEADTMFERGRIAALREILELPDEVEKARHAAMRRELSKAKPQLY